MSPRFEVEISADYEHSLREFVANSRGTISKPEPSRRDANEVWKKQVSIVIALVKTARELTDPLSKQKSQDGAVEILKKLVFPEEFTASATSDGLRDHLLTYFTEAVSSDLPDSAYFTNTQSGIVLKNAYKPEFHLTPTGIIKIMEIQGITDGRKKSLKEIAAAHHISPSTYYFYRIHKPARRYFIEKGLITSHLLAEREAQFTQRNSSARYH